MQTRFRFWISVALILAVTKAFAAEPAGNTAPDLKEVLDLVRANLPGVTESELNQAAVDGIVSKLRGKVRLAGDDAKSSSTTNAPLIARASVLEEDFACVRIGRVDSGLADEIKSRVKQINSTNKLKGIVFDARFCDGEDFSAAASVVDLFLPKERALLSWNGGEAKSRSKDDAFNLPVAVLVNKETVAAPEAMAAMFRESGTGLVIGNTTAGAAMTMRDFTLKSGQRLRIAGTSYKLADGTELSASGVKPDITVEVSLETERAFRDDAFAKPPTPSTLAKNDNASRTNRSRRISEAILVREKKEGVSAEEILASPDREPERAVIRDPALARAVDILKGLAVVRKASL